VLADIQNIKGKKRQKFLLKELIQKAKTTEN